jgi:alpha-beta hydrolase superfamily lysophospholipase
MRGVLFVVIVALFALGGYLALTGWFLAKTVAGTLALGPLATSIAQADPPEDPFVLGYVGSPTDALGLPFETITLETPLGPIEAWLVPAAGAEAGRAIYVHGIAGRRENGYRQLSILHEAGWTVLLTTYRNHGGAPRSEEGRYAFGLTEWPDLEAAVAWLAPEPDGPGLLVTADSMGAAVLGQFLSRSPLSDRVAAIALDSPAISFSAVTRQLARANGSFLGGAVAWTAGRLVPRLTGLPLSDAEVAGVFTAFPGPVFIAHGTADRIVPIAPSEALAANRRAPTATLWTGADHLGSFAEDPAAYREALAAFLADLGR